MRTFSLFVLFVYWSIIILAPVISDEVKLVRAQNSIIPIEKPKN
tara:strand:- start:160 stop:291 length:132 start_codon:yes stop_codon:yes gene_type:complete